MDGLNFSILAFIALLVLAGSKQTEAAVSCNRVGNGFACQGDRLQGFIECSKGIQTSSKSCPTNQMCSCGMNLVCRDLTVGRCVKRPSFPASVIPMDFTVSFNGIHVFTNPISNLRLTSSGTIWQDTTTGNEKFKIKQTFNKSAKTTRSIVRVIRREGAKYVQYTLIEYYTTSSPTPTTQYCNKKVLDKFEDFFYDLRTVSQQVPKQDASDDDVFVYRNGPLDAGSGFTTKRWTMGQRHITQQYVPWRLNVLKSSGALGKSAEYSQLTLGYFYQSKPVDAYFVVPQPCTQTKHTVL